jgi:hypothetical protein
MLSIRTQDRMALVPYDTTVSIAHMIDSDYAVVVDYGDVKKNKWLGLYHSKERALEVLDEISKATIGRLIINSPSINNKHWTNEYVTYVSQGSQEQIIPLPTVYQMPKE